MICEENASNDLPRPTEVVTAFVWDGARVLLALRSDRVSTYPRHWAGVSGYLESSDPLAWAYVEIAEETGISREHLTLCRAGEPLEVNDAQRRLSFLVHPFLFRVDDPALARADWEAVRLEWVPIEEVRQRLRQPAVPQLYEAFERVWLGPAEIARMMPEPVTLATGCATSPREPASKAFPS